MSDANANQAIIDSQYPPVNFPAPYSSYLSKVLCSADNTSDVSPGEVCTLDQLTQLGIYDSVNYIIPSDTSYKDLKTFNPEKDNKENRTKSLCRQTLQGDSANTNCLFEHGAGYIRKKGDADTCITYDCPPGFEREGNDCKKILLDAKLDKRAQCSERWSDWFMIPNYHIGNKYSQASDGTCYAPCPPHYIPNYASDPVDNENIDFSSSDKLNTCVARNIYFDGKYADGSEYCPLAWIYRVSATPDSMNKDYIATIHASGSNINRNKIYNNLMKNTRNIATNLVEDANILFEDATIDTPAMSGACVNLYTTDRIARAYDICSNLHKNEEEYVTQLAKGDTSGMIDQKITILKQSCNAIFCPTGEDADDSAFGLIGKDRDRDSICFSSIGNVDPTKTKTVDKDSPDYPTPDATPGENIFYYSLKLVLFLIIIPVILILLYLFMRYAGPIIYDVILVIWRFITLNPIIINAETKDLNKQLVIIGQKWSANNNNKDIARGLKDSSWRLYTRKWSYDQ